MKKALTKAEKNLYYYEMGTKKEGQNRKMYGDCTGLRGDCTGLRGDCTGLEGDCTGLRGNCSGLIGDFENCEITEDDKKKGINISDLIKD